MKHIFSVDTWLPVFSGFYSTIWDTEGQEEQEIANINDERKAKGLPPVDYDMVEWGYKEYRQQVVEHVTYDVTVALQKLGIVHSGKFQELRSPREYNFANDSINIQFKLTATNIKKIAAYLDEHKAEFAKYLKDHYTSYDGFCSSYSSDVDAWAGNVLGDTMAHGHKAGAVLNFILLNEEGPDYELNLYEHASGNGAYLTATNYRALMGDK